MPVRLRALVFDFDGTIAETERDGHRAAYNAAFVEMRLPWNWSVETYGALLATAGGKERLRNFIGRERPELGDAGTARLASDVHATKRRHFAALAGSLELRPGILRIVREALEANIALAIATTAAPDGVTAVLQRDPAFEAAFSVIAAGDDVPLKKPAPDIYRYALDALGCRSEEALAFEDSRVGLRSARAAGLATIVTPSIYTQDENFDGATALLSDLGEPGAPLRTLAGPVPPGGVVDIDYLRSLLATNAVHSEG